MITSTELDEVTLKGTVGSSNFSAETINNQLYCILIILTQMKKLLTHSRISCKEPKSTSKYIQKNIKPIARYLEVNSSLQPHVNFIFVVLYNSYY